MTTARIYDISPPLHDRIAVWPGDADFQREIILSHDAGDGADLSTLHASAHVGAHADAFSHVLPNAPAIDQMPLAPYIGPCQIIHIPVPRGHAITTDDLPAAFDAPRVLLKTDADPDRTRFREDFAALSPEAADALIQAGAQLIGIDSPSVDLFSSKSLPVHHRLAEARIATLEGLLLNDVSPGIYELIAIPLRIIGADASPVRAILRLPATN